MNAIATWLGTRFGSTRVATLCAGSTFNDRRRARPLRFTRTGAGQCGWVSSEFMSHRPVDDMMFQRPGLLLRNGLAQHRLTGAMDAVRVAADQRMPVKEILALGEQAIGAGGG